MKVIGKIIILWSFIFNSLSPVVAYAVEDNPAFSQSGISEANSTEVYKNDLIESSVSMDTIGSEELTTEPIIQDSEEKIDSETEDIDSSNQVSESDEETKSTELDSVDLIDSSRTHIKLHRRELPAQKRSIKTKIIKEKIQAQR